MIFTLEFGDYTFPNQTFEVEDFPTFNNTVEEKIVRQHGAEIQTPFLKAKKFKIVGKIHNSSKVTSLAELDDMQKNLLVDKNFFRDRSDREIEAFAKKITPSQDLGSDKALINVKIDMVAPSPFFQATGASIETSFSLVGTSVFNLPVGGNAFNEPKIHIFANGGTINDDFELTNVTDGNKSFKFRGVILDGQTVVLDSKELTVLNNGVDGISDFEGEFINLLAATNQFSYSGATCLLTFERKNRWF